MLLLGNLLKTIFKERGLAPLNFIEHSSCLVNGSTFKWQTGADLIFHTLLREWQELLHRVLNGGSFDCKHYDSKPGSSLRRDVALVDALGKALACVADSSEWFSLVDIILCRMLRRRITHHYLQAAAIRALTLFDTASSSYAARIHKIYLPFVYQLRSVKRPQERPNDIVLAQLNKLLSKWPVQPSDSVLLQLNVDQESLAKVGLLNPHVVQRIEQLSRELNPFIKSKAAGTLVEATKMSIPELLSKLGDTQATYVAKLFKFQQESRAHKLKDGKKTFVNAVESVESVESVETVETVDPALLKPVVDASLDDLSSLTDSGALEISDPCSPVMTFGLGKASIIFSRAPFARDLHLQNKSDSPQVFNIDLRPDEMFLVNPQSGILAPGETVKVHLALTAAREGITEGQLSLRTSDGFVLESLNIQGPMTRPISVFPTLINFGVCPTGSSLTGYVSIKNWTLEPVTASTTITGLNSACFAFENADLEIPPGAKLKVGIKFKPSLRQEVASKAVIADKLGGVFEIDLSGTGGNAVDVLEDELDFGHIDYLTKRGAMRSFFLRNNVDLPTTVYLNSSSPEEITIHQVSKSVKLASRETRKVFVSWQPTWSGLRQESIRVVACQSQQAVVTLKAFSGLMVSSFVHEQIVMPTVVVNELVATQIPIVNQYDQPVQLDIKLSSDDEHPFSLRSLNTEQFGRKAMMGQMDVKYSSETGALTATLGPRSNLPVSIIFGNGHPGVFSARLVVSMKKPRAVPSLYQFLVVGAVLEDSRATARKWELSDYQQAICNLFPVDATVFNPLEDRRALVAQIRKQPVKALLAAEEEMPPRPPPQFYRSESCPLEAHANFISVMVNSSSYTGQLNLSEFSLTAGGVVPHAVAILYNSNESKACNYHFFLSPMFSTETPNSGTIPPNSALEIGINYKPPLNRVDVVRETAFGTLTVLVDNLTLLSIPVLGVFGDIVDLEARPSTEQLNFGPVASKSLATRKVMLRNKLATESVVECKFATVVLPGYSINATVHKPVILAGRGGDCNFKMTMGKLLMKPFEHLLADVTFQGADPGTYVARFHLEIVDTAPRYIGGELVTSNQRRVHRQIEMSAYVLGNYISLDADVVDFGVNMLVPNAQPTPKSVTLSYDATVPILEDSRVSEASEPFSLVKVEGQPEKFTVSLNAAQPGLNLGAALFGDAYTLVQIPLAALNVLPKLYTDLSPEIRYSVGEGCLEAHVNVRLGLCHAFKGKTLLGDWLNGCGLPFSNVTVVTEQSPLLKLQVATQGRWMDGARLTVSVQLCPQRLLESPYFGRLSTVAMVDLSLDGSKLLRLVHHISAEVEPPLKVQDSLVDFGVVPLFSRFRKKFVFQNVGTIPVPWQLSLADYTAATPFRVFPLQGVLIPGDIQVCDVTFNPSSATRKRILGTLVTNLMETPIALEGTGGASKLEADLQVVDFGVVRVSQPNVTRRVVLKNCGNMPTKYFVESPLQLFACDPEQGILEGGGLVELTLTCNTQRAGLYRDYCVKICTNEPGVQQILKIPILVNVTYPELLVHTKAVDFGIALLHSANRKQVDIENLGQAEALISLASNHTTLNLDPTVQTILPHSRKLIDLVFEPQKVEVLDSRIFIKLIGTARSDYFALSVKATVGVPKLVLCPPDALDTMDWGTCKLGESILKTFTMENQGNISLSWSMPVKQTAIFQVSPGSGVLGCGEKQQVTVTFRPTLLTSYEEHVTLQYEFFKLTSFFRGSGGLASLQVDSARPLSAQSLEAWILSTKNQVIATHADLGVCRTMTETTKHILVKNCGNLAANFKAFFKVDDARNVSTETTAQGLSIVNPTGQVPAFARGAIKVLVRYHKSAKLNHTLVIKHDHGILEYDVRVELADSQLQLCSADCSTVLWDSSTAAAATDSVKVNLGVQALNTETLTTLYLVNPSPFKMEYFVQPTGIQELQLFPMRGTIAPRGSKQAINVAFRPTSDTKVQGSVKILWEKSSPALQLQLTGYGGLGMYAIAYADSKNRETHSLDFGMVPFHSVNDSRIAIVNMGAVSIPIQLSVNHDDFALAVLSTFSTSEANCDKPKAQQVKDSVVLALQKPAKKVMQWSKELHLSLPVEQAIEVGCRFSTATNPLPVVGQLMLTAPIGKMEIPLKGKGGTIDLWHEGNLDFGDVASNFTYTKKVKIYNRGTIPAMLNFEWQIVGRHPAGQANANSKEPFISLEEVFTGLDPRSGWCRQEFSKKNGGRPPKTALDHWSLLRLIVANSSENANSTKRRQLLLNLVASKSVRSQSMATTAAFVKATPGKGLLQPDSHVEVSVQLNLASEDTFLATLIARSSSASIPPYDIPLNATPKLVSVYCSDMSTLNFQRQSLGQSYSLERAFTNKGHQDLSWSIHHKNSALAVSPASGFLPVGQSVTVKFTFTPFEETPQTNHIFFEPEFSQPIRLSMFGGGGAAKCSLSKYRKFDFGPCMVGKGTCSFLPIVNEGSALLRFKSFAVLESDTFFQGIAWPSLDDCDGVLELNPGARIELPIVFHPRNDSPPAGKLVVKSSMETWEIELVGQGREAVLILSRQALEFHECLVGNTYEQVLKLKNVGDVNYPVTFACENFPDIEFTPTNMVIPPFSEKWVVVSFTPTSIMKQLVQIHITSPYSSHTVAMSLFSGTADLEISEEFLDYGLFEKTSHPKLQLTIKNAGTMMTNYSIRDASKPRRFEFENGRGILFPGKTATVSVVHAKETVGVFDGLVQVRNDVVEMLYSIAVRGQCEEAVVRPEEIEQLHMGICPVSFPTTKNLTLANYGAFPLTYELKLAYPLKASPTHGIIEGFGKDTICITWNPSGSYELRSTVIVSTNVGEFQTLVRGRGAFSELSLSTGACDFGIGAVGYSYSLPVMISNKGKVPLTWTALGFREAFSASKTTGQLAVREQETIQVNFKPLSNQKYTCSLLLDCKGSAAKELLLSGVGGRYSLDVVPKVVEFYKSPCDLTVYREVDLHNDGDVTLRLSFVDGEKYEMITESKAKDQGAESGSLTIGAEDNVSGGQIKLLLPGNLVVNPGDTARVVIGVTALSAGPFQTEFWIRSTEKCTRVQVVGDGVRIYSSARVTEIFKTEHLTATTLVNPLILETTNDEWGYGVGPTELERMLRVVSRTTGVFLKVVEEIEALSNAYSNLFHKTVGVPSPTLNDLNLSMSKRNMELHLFEKGSDILGQILSLKATLASVNTFNEKSFKLEFSKILAAVEELKSKPCMPLAKGNIWNVPDVRRVDEPHDFLIESVISYGGEPSIEEIQVVDEIRVQYPIVSDPAAGVLARPPAFPQVDLGKHKLALEKEAQQALDENQRKLKMKARARRYQSLDRKSRNAKTTGIWATYDSY